LIQLSKCYFLYYNYHVRNIQTEKEIKYGRRSLLCKMQGKERNEGR